MLTHLSLFTGIAGFELGMQLAGLDVRTVGYCEIDKYCQRVIQARIRDGYLDDAPIWPDICTLPCDEYKGLVDIITGGFPCQDISVAGKGAGIHGERSGLWWEMWRCIGEIRPRFVLLENVSAILTRGGVEVIGSLAQIGYDCEWHLVPAASVGAPHLRWRWWCLVTNSASQGCVKATKRKKGQVARCDWWSTVTSISRVDDGGPDRMVQRRSLGNAVVPAVVAKFPKEITNG